MYVVTGVLLARQNESKITINCAAKYSKIVNKANRGDAVVKKSLSISIFPLPFRHLLIG
jgi:hypothetical protein